MKNKKLVKSISVKVLAAILALIMLSGTVFGLIAYFV